MELFFYFYYTQPHSIVINIWPVKPFETVHVIKGYTNKIALTWTTTFFVSLDGLSKENITFDVSPDNMHDDCLVCVVVNEHIPAYLT